MKQMHLAGIVVTVMAVVMVSQPAWAARTRMHELAESSYYKEKAGGMIGRGLLNAVTSFVDPLVHIVNETKAGPPLVGTLRGVATGLGCGVLRLGSGAVDIATFWVPGFNGFPVSDSYENCIDESGGMAAAPLPSLPQAPSAIEPVASDPTTIIPPTAGTSAWESSVESEPEPVADILPVKQPEKTWKK